MHSVCWRTSSSYTCLPMTDLTWPHAWVLKAYPASGGYVSVALFNPDERVSVPYIPIWNISLRSSFNAG